MTDERLKEMAQFVTAFRFTPLDYWSMTWGERTAIVDAHNRSQQKR